MNIALIAHDGLKLDLVMWVKHNEVELSKHTLYATGTTGLKIKEASGLPVTCLKSGPYGGDQQIGAMIAKGECDCLIFFWNPLSPHPHDVDVKALLRIAVLNDTLMACNKTTADFIISSPLWQEKSIKFISESI